MTNEQKPSRRRRHAAMKDVGERDDYRDRAGGGRGAKSADVTASPPRGPRRSPDSNTRSRHSRRDSVSNHRHGSRRHNHHRQDREKGYDGHGLSDSTRQTDQQPDLIPRYRDNPQSSDFETGRAPRSRSRERAVDASPSTAKRHRSRSDSPGYSSRKKSKKQSSSAGRRDDSVSRRDSRRRRHHSPHRDRRDKSPRRHSHSHKSSLPTRAEDLSLEPRHRLSPKSPRDFDSGGRDMLEERGDTKTEKITYHSRSHTSYRESRRPSSRRPTSPSGTDLSDSRGDHPDRRPAGDLGYPPRSPKAHRDRRHRDGSGEPHHSSRSDLDEEMSSRRGYRASNHPMHPPKSHYGNPSRGYPSSPQHNNHYHEPSPTYGGGRSAWNGQQHSPSHQNSHQYQPPDGNHPPSNGQSGSFHNNASNSPPLSAPSGPMSKYPQNSYRGGRGGGFRGGAFSSRGSHRGSNFKKSQWNSSNSGSQGPPPRGHYYPNEDDVHSRRQSATSAHNDGNEANAEDIDMANNGPELSKHEQDDDLTREEELDDTKDPPSRQPPSDPRSQPSSGPKFSFAFKASSKPTLTAPKPEISQKFNAVPQRPGASKQTQNQDQDPPRSAPTEPASARNRSDFRAPPEGPKMAPRMRKVKKIMRRQKTRPCLSTEHIHSDSVFFRKPGNESVVGSGTYGKVFKGLNVYTKGLVALKRIRMEGERDGFPVTAVREIKLLQSLRHKNIVNLQEVMVEKNDCFMVFEYLSHDLTGLLNHPSFRLDPAQRKHLARQLFEGLDYLHVRGVLHRDIKAANILVSNEGILKLADFGLARFYAKRHQLDYTNRVITIWYRSPELLMGETKYTAAVDVWSAACVMAEIFTKTAIFAGDGTELSQIEKIYGIMGTPSRQEWPDLVNMAWFELLRPSVKRKSVFAAKYRDKLSRAAFNLLERMLCYDPTKRPTAGEALQHPYFTSEEPLAKQAVELSSIDGEWHEFESKALRKENERKDREARRAARDDAHNKDRKRPISSHDRDKGPKRTHVDEKLAAGQVEIGDTTQDV